ncbi:MAG: DUF7535 family protein [Halodesulfurarchaeum sp.]
MDTVTPPTPTHTAPEMTAFGWMMAIGIAIVLLPLWPLLAIMWFLAKQAEGQTDEEIGI